MNEIISFISSLDIPGKWSVFSEYVIRLMTEYSSGGEVYIHTYIGMLRYTIPVIFCWILLRCAWPLISFRREPEIWGWLKTGEEQLPLVHWENVIGRSTGCDICFPDGTISRNHAVVTRYDDGSWTITDANSKTGTFVNGQRVEICALHDGDTITIGSKKLTLQPITHRQELLQSELRTKGNGVLSNIANVVLLTVLQLMILLGFLLTTDSSEHWQIFMGLFCICIAQWALLILYGMLHRRAFELETLAFLLCTMGMAAIATVKPSEAGKQAAAMLIGVLTYLLVGWSLRNLERAKRFRYLAVMAGVGLLLVTLVFGREYYGAKNWIVIGGFSLQPSELTKICFVYAGASTMDRVMNKRNLILFIAYSVVICGLLALMNDFGTALIFFCAFLIIAYLRSGSVGTVALACSSLGIAGMLAIRIAPHALKRFSVWRNVWSDPFNSGFQQTKAMICIASGGFFGLGPGRGWLQNVFAADSDIVFATISEEWGLLPAIMLVLCIAVMGAFAIRTVAVSRSSFYAIGACTAAGILLIQTMLNCLGTVDVLPFTGVTFPFLSNGGTSMICSWGMLAFIKAADTRQDASFAVRRVNTRGSEE